MKLGFHYGERVAVLPATIAAHLHKVSKKDITVLLTLATEPVAQVDLVAAKNVIAARGEYTAAEIDELWAEREESELTKRLLEENGLPNLARIFTERRYVEKDNIALSQQLLALVKERGFFNQ